MIITCVYCNAVFEEEANRTEVKPTEPNVRWSANITCPKCKKYLYNVQSMDMGDKMVGRSDTKNGLLID